MIFATITSYEISYDLLMKFHRKFFMRFDMNLYMKCLALFFSFAFRMRTENIY